MTHSKETLSSNISDAKSSDILSSKQSRGEDDLESETRDKVDIALPFKLKSMSNDRLKPRGSIAVNSSTFGPHALKPGLKLKTSLTLVITDLSSSDEDEFS